MNDLVDIVVGEVIVVRETLIFALNKFSLKARNVPQIKMTVPYGVFFIQIY